jgi:hypothetical protein
MSAALYEAILRTLKAMGESAMFVFLSKEWESLLPGGYYLGPEQDDTPHTYRSLQDMVEYQGEELFFEEPLKRVYILFPVPLQILKPFLDKYQAENPEPAHSKGFGVMQ